MRLIDRINKEYGKQEKIVRDNLPDWLCEFVDSEVEKDTKRKVLSQLGYNLVKSRPEIEVDDGKINSTEKWFLEKVEHSKETTSTGSGIKTQEQFICGNKNYFQKIRRSGAFEEVE